MNTYVALLRGINVGGHKSVGMEDLRAMLRDLGHAEVETYLRSGNAIFASPRQDATALEGEIEAQVENQLGLDVKVLLRTPSELAGVVAANPFPAATAEPSKLHVAFVSAMPGAARLAGMDPAQFEPDELRPGDGVIYLWYPNGAGRSKLTNDLIERRFGVTSTSRNWNTVTKLLERASARRPPRPLA